MKALHLIYLVMYLVRPADETIPQRSLQLSGNSRGVAKGGGGREPYGSPNRQLSGF